MSAAVAHTILDAAVQLAGWGFRVHPLRGKHPIENNWPRVASNDADAVRRLFEAKPHANIGIATGHGLLVLDIDPRHGGDASIAGLESKHSPLPATVRVRTGGGGWHVYLRVAAGVRLRNTAGKLGAGLDIRSDGGQVVAPPSIHPDNGAPYRWAEGCSPTEIEVAPAPAWLLEMLAPRQVTAKTVALPTSGDLVHRARRYTAQMPAAISGAGGHGAAFAVAQALVRGFALDRETALSILANDYNPRCQPPWSERELAHKIDSALNDSSLPIGYLRDVSSDRSERPRRVAPVVPIRQNAADTDLTAPLDTGYACLCRILRTQSLRQMVLGEGELEFNEQTLFPTIARRPLRPDDLGRLREQCELRFRDDRHRALRFKKEQVQDAVLQVARERPYHPVADWLNRLTWDGVPRIDFVAEDVLGINTSDQPLAVSMLRSWFVSAVARALDPGCKVDTVLILKGRQSARKSTFFQTLAGDEWFTNTQIDLHNPNAVLVMAGVWILELAELSAMLRAKDAESVKQFITCATDRIRPPYEPAPRVFPRCSVIVGTTNSDDFLRDASGSRRYWPIDVGDQAINIDLVMDWREQLWAEAVVHYRAGAKWWLDEREELDLNKTNRSFEASDPWDQVVEDYLARSGVLGVTVSDLLTHAVRKDTGSWTRGDENRVAEILKRLGFERAGRHLDGDGKKRHTWQRRKTSPPDTPQGGGP